jgi:hypothetical protein
MKPFTLTNYHYARWGDRGLEFLTFDWDECRYYWGCNVYIASIVPENDNNKDYDTDMTGAFLIKSTLSIEQA